MEIKIFSTGRCNNNCYYCLNYGDASIKFYDVGKTAKERQALLNLFKALSEISDSIAVSGGDPLLNLPFIEALTTSYIKRKRVVINPLSILRPELAWLDIKQPLPDSLKALKARVSNNKINSKTLRALYLLRKFDSVSVSVDSSCFPDKKQRDLALKFFMVLAKKYRLKIVKKNLVCAAYNDDGKILLKPGGTSIKSKANRALSGIVGGKLRDLVLDKFALVSYNPLMVGRLRQQADQGNISKACIHFNKSGKFQKINCDAGGLKLFFELRGTKVYLAFLPCCNAGISPYIVLHSKISINNSKNALCDMLQKEANMIKNSVLRDYSGNFGSLVRKAEKLIFEQSGNVVDIVGSTPSLFRTPLQCEVCYTLALELKMARISPAKWHLYLKHAGAD